MDLVPRFSDLLDCADKHITVGIQLLSLADLMLTLVHLSADGMEANPLLRLVLQGGMVSFAAVKMGFTTVGLIILTKSIRSHENIRYVLLSLFVVYLCVIAYHLHLIPVLC